ncbi:Arm DNA-binding domain-containing protein [Gammaproteobacteria bacterium]|nr:Arm DNA-binding domain-containing protein [Gammaproteobacteria bacterium]
MGLTELKVRKAQPREKMYRLSDQKGLYLQVNPNGSKYWRYKYRLRKNGRLRETLLALGTYPEISLAIARERHWRSFNTKLGRVFQTALHARTCLRPVRHLMRGWSTRLVHLRTTMSFLQGNVIPPRPSCRNPILRIFQIRPYLGILGSQAV